MRRTKTADVKQELDRLLLDLCWHEHDRAYYVLRYRCTIRFPGHVLHRGDLLDVRGPIQPRDYIGWQRRDDGFAPPPWTRLPRALLTTCLQAVVPPAMMKGRLHRKVYRTESGGYCCICPQRLHCCKKRNKKRR